MAMITVLKAKATTAWVKTSRRMDWLVVVTSDT